MAYNETGLRKKGSIGLNWIRGMLLSIMWGYRLGHDKECTVFFFSFLFWRGCLGGKVYELVLG